MTLSEEQFGATPEGARAEFFSLSNDRGMEVKTASDFLKRGF